MKKITILLIMGLIALQGGYMEDTLGIHCTSAKEYYLGKAYTGKTAKQKIKDMIHSEDPNNMGVVPSIKKDMEEINAIFKEMTLINEKEKEVDAEINYAMRELNKEIEKQAKLLVENNKIREKHNEIISGIKSDHIFVEYNDSEPNFDDNFTATEFEFNDTLSIQDINDTYQIFLDINYSKRAMDKAKPIVSHKLDKDFRARIFEVKDCINSNNSNHSSINTCEEKKSDSR